MNEEPETPSPTEARPEDAPEQVVIPKQIRLALFGIVIAALAALFWPQGQADGKAPGGFLVDANGRPTPIGPKMAPVTLVHFWATWCPPCLGEIPLLDELSEDLMAEESFRVLMIAVDDDPVQVENFIGREASKVLYDTDWELAHRYGTRKLPETYLVVGDTVVEKYVGAADWSDPAIRQQIRSALDGLGSN